MTSNCAATQRAQGILIPTCPPQDEIRIYSPAEYYLYALASHENYKATYDCLFSN